LSDAAIPLNQKVYYSAATFGTGMSGFVAHGAAFFFLTQFLGLDPFILSAIQVAPIVWDAFTDPIMGTISDRTETRWGKRRPYLLIGGLGWQIGIILGWVIPFHYVPWAEANGHSMAWIYIFMLFMTFWDRTMHTVHHVPYLALGGEMSDSPGERTKMATGRAIAAQIGKIIGLLIGKWALDKYGAEAAYYPMALIFCSIALVCVVIPAFFCRERTFKKIKTKKAPSMKEMVMLLKFRPYLIFTLGFLIAMLGFNFSSQFMIFYGRFWLFDNSAIITFQVAVFAATLISLFYWPRIVRNVGNRRTMQGMIFGLSALFIVCYFALKPYYGDPTFTGKPLRIFKAVGYKAMTMNLFYKTNDIEDVGLLKQAVKADSLLGERYFADLDPETETDEEFIERLNVWLEQPGIYESIKDKIEFGEDSFEKRNEEDLDAQEKWTALSAASRDEDALLSKFLAGETLSGKLNSDGLAMLNNALSQPFFFEEARKTLEGLPDFKKLPKDVKTLHEKTLAARLRIKLSEFLAEGTMNVDLAEMDFSPEQVVALFEIMNLEDLIEAPTMWEFLKRELGWATSEEVLAKKRAKRLPEELRKAFDLIQIRERIGIKGTKATTTLAVTETDYSRLRKLNRRMIELAYGNEKFLGNFVNGFQVLNIDTAKDEVILLLIKTRDDRDQPFESLSAGQQHDVRTLNRLLLVHRFKKAFNKDTLVNSALPSMALLTLIVVGVLIGILNGALTIIPGVIIPDIADVDELKTGHRRMGVFFGVESFALKMGTMWVPPIKGAILVILGIKGKLDLTTTPEQLDGMMQGMRAWWAFPAGIGCFGAFLILLFYPLTRKKMNEIREELNAQREAEG